ncbi:MAG: zinc-ribbon domain-containing protein [Hominilimicola sp.]
MIGSIYRRTFEILKKIPFKLWGISLLSGVLTLVVLILGAVPLIIIPVIAAISAGMIAVYYKAYNGGEADTKTLLGAFGSFKDFKHVAGGMCWMYLWKFLWFLIPIAGPVIAVIKSLSYAFTPYILNEEKSVGATDALKKSMQDTKGYKLNMFAAIILPTVAFLVVSIILGLLALIPYVGVIFSVINFLVSLVYGLFAPMFLGLVKAGFYEYGKKPVRVSQPAPKIAPAHTIMAPPAAADVIATSEDTVQSVAVKTCSVCGHENTPDKKFCMKCGAKL